VIKFSGSTHKWQMAINSTITADAVFSCVHNAEISNSNKTEKTVANLHSKNFINETSKQKINMIYST